jgi:hypothetical protein
MRGFGSPEKDREAEAMISQSVRTMPDAPYMLVQSVLAQEHALQEAGKRIEDLEAQVRSLQGEGPPRAPAGSGSFLGGLLGGGRAASQPESSVPVIGSRAVPSGLGERPGWGGQPPSPQAAPAAGGGGFLRSAMTTAAGVAGGMLAAGAISNMLGGSSTGTAGSGGAGTATTAQQTPPAAETQPAKAEQPQSDDASVQDASYEEDSDWGGGDLDLDV